MVGYRGTIGVFAILLSAAAVPAAVTPSWRVNTINLPPILEFPELANARSISLMVEVTGNSTFAGGGIEIPVSYLDLYQWRRFGNDAMDRPTAAEIGQFPTAFYDTSSTPAIVGPLNGSGPPLLGTTNLQPSSGDHRFGTLVNISWAPLSQSGFFEVFTMTVGGTKADSTPVPIEFGNVRDGLAPTHRIGLPPIPIAMQFPEAAIAGYIGFSALALLQRGMR